MCAVYLKKAMQKRFSFLLSFAFFVLMMAGFSHFERENCREKFEF